LPSSVSNRDIPQSGHTEVKVLQDQNEPGADRPKSHQAPLDGAWLRRDFHAVSA
jgi:hypothetical protein